MNIYESVRKISFTSYNVFENDYNYDLNDLVIHNTILDSMILTEEEHVSYATRITQDKIIEIIRQNESRLFDLIHRDYISTYTYWSNDNLCCVEFDNRNDVPKDVAHIIYVKFYKANDNRCSYIFDRIDIQSNDDIKIHVNLYDYLKYISAPQEAREEELYHIKSSVAHELHHMLGMYADPRRNSISTTKKNIYEVVSKRNGFNLPIDEYEWLQQIVYCLSPSEQEAHLNGTSEFVETNITKQWFQRQFNQMYAFVVGNYNRNKRQITDVASIIALSIMNINKVRMLSLLLEFRNLVRDFIKERIVVKKENIFQEIEYQTVENQDVSDVRMIVLGYYLLNHKMLDFMDLKKRDVVPMLTEDEVRHTIKEPSYIRSKDYYKKLRDIVYTSVQINYHKYEKKIYNDCIRIINRNVDNDFIKNAKTDLYPLLTNFDFIK